MSQCHMVSLHFRFVAVFRFSVCVCMLSKQDGTISKVRVASFISACASSMFTWECQCNTHS
jgi:hypothetical protein